jgi:hypothetical protein
VGPRAGLEDLEKREFLTYRVSRPLCRTARSQSLYGLSYSGSLISLWSLWNETSSIQYKYNSDVIETFILRAVPLVAYVQCTLHNYVLTMSMNGFGFRSAFSEECADFPG